MPSEAFPMSYGPSRVFLIPEILETILLSADMRTLLISQRVSSYWYNLIAESPRLQRALFFEPDPNATLQLNPLLRETFPFCFPQYEGDFRVYAKSKDTGQESEFRDHGEFNVRGIFRKAAAFQRADASWRRMLVQQPPLKEVCHLVTMEPDQRILYCHSFLPGSRNIAGEICPSHIRMPDILPLVLAPTCISFGGLSRGPLTVKVRVLWHQKPPRIENRGTAGLIERMVDAHGVVVHNIGALEASEALEEVARMRQIFLDCGQ